MQHGPQGSSRDLVKQKLSLSHPSSLTGYVSNQFFVLLDEKPHTSASVHNLRHSSAIAIRRFVKTGPILNDDAKFIMYKKAGVVAKLKPTQRPCATAFLCLWQVFFPQSAALIRLTREDS
jgi:hypothetical protein